MQIPINLKRALLALPHFSPHPVGLLLDLHFGLLLLLDLLLHLLETEGLGASELDFSVLVMVLLDDEDGGFFDGLVEELCVVFFVFGFELYVDFFLNLAHRSFSNRGACSFDLLNNDCGCRLLLDWQFFKLLLLFNFLRRSAFSFASDSRFCLTISKMRFSGT